MSGPIFTNPNTNTVVDPTYLSYQAYSFAGSTTYQMGWPIFGSGSSAPMYPVAGIMDIQASGSGAVVVLPDASQRAFASTLINNRGANAFQINDFVGDNLLLISPGSSALFYTTAVIPAGSWQIMNFGAVVASTNASTLAGNGLVAIGVTLQDAFPVTMVAAPITLASSHRATVQEWTGGTNGWNLTSSGTLGNNWFSLIRNAGTGVLTLTPLNGGDTIDGSGTGVFNPGDSCILVCTGSSFITVGRGRNVTFSYTTLTKTSTTGGSGTGFGTAGGPTYTETATDYANVIQFWKGALSQAQTITLPTVPNIYFMSNLTTGGFSITFTTGSGTTYSLAANSATVLLCDGTNIVAANTVNVGSLTAIQLSPGANNNATLAWATDGVATGLYAPASHQVAVTINNVETAIFSATNFTSLLPISGGTF
jgi:hypothetical protein